MKKTLVTLIILVITGYQAKCQMQSDTITMVDNGYVISDKMYSPKEICDVIKDNAPALDAMRMSISIKNAARVSGFAGGFCMGFALVEYMRSNTLKWPVAAVGLGLVMTSFQCGISSRNYGFQAVRLYNSKVSHPAAMKALLDLGMTSNGISLICRF